jgi:hypothetical protein
MDDDELRQLRATASARNIDPAHLTKSELLHLLALQDKQKSKGRLGGAAAKERSNRRHGGIEQLTRAVAGPKLAKQRSKDVAIADTADTDSANDAALEQAERAKRLAAVMSMHGIWKDDPTKPQDGAEYQREVRAEWRWFCSTPIS